MSGSSKADNVPGNGRGGGGGGFHTLDLAKTKHNKQQQKTKNKLQPTFRLLDIPPFSSVTKREYQPYRECCQYQQCTCLLQQSSLVVTKILTASSNHTGCVVKLISLTAVCLSLTAVEPCGRRHTGSLYMSEQVCCQYEECMDLFLQSDPVTTKTLTADNYQTGCKVILPLPTANGQHTYTVTLIPGRQIVTADPIGISEYTSSS